MSRLPLGLVALLLHVGCQQCCNDHDCAVLAAQEGRDNDELCVEGSCAKADAPVDENADCDNDGDCDDGQLCAFGACANAPECLTLDRAFVGRLNATTGTVVATSSDCQVTFAYDFPAEGLSTSASASRIERDGTFVPGVNLESGRWDSGLRVGSFVAGVNEIEFGTDTYACVDDGDCAGQLLVDCVAGDDGVGVCR